MVIDSTLHGLVVTPSIEASDVLEQLLAHCGWPALMGADRRSLARQLELHAPARMLFWLDEPQAAASARSLIAWLRERGPRLYYIVLAYQLDSSFEPALRAAGAHSYWPVCGSVVQVFDEALWPLLSCERRQSSMPSRAALTSPHRLPRNPGKFHDLKRPP